MSMSSDQAMSLINTAVPLIMAFVRRHHEQTNEIPRVEEVQAHIKALGDQIIASNEAWIAAHEEDTPPT